MFRPLNLIFFSVQLSGVTHWVTCWSEESSVCLTPQLGHLARNPVALECPPGLATATPSANW